MIAITKELLKSHDITEVDSVWFGTMKQVQDCFTFNNITLFKNMTKWREYYYALPI